MNKGSAAASSQARGIHQNLCVQAPLAGGLTINHLLVRVMAALKDARRARAALVG
jgi:hypothetical protein